MSTRSHTATPAEWTLRPLELTELRSWYALLYEAFPATHDFDAGLEETRPLVEPDRALVACYGDGLAGTASANSFTVSLPGGPRPVAGITGVAVHPTWRRQGILRALMHRQLSDIYARGTEAVAILFSSEASIYERFGYGPAHRTAELTIRRPEATLRQDAGHDPGLRTWLGSPGEVLAELQTLQASAAQHRPGDILRSPERWHKLVADPVESRQGYGVWKCALVRDSDTPRGYALYRLRPGWSEDALPQATLHVAELYAADPAAYVQLWRHLSQRDLVDTIQLQHRPTDDPLLHLLADPRRLRARLGEGVWVRLVDLPTALCQRSYSAPIDVVLDITDESCPWNAGRWHLSSDGTETHCAPTQAAADLGLDVSLLGAAYLGATRLSSYASAGRLTEHQPGTLARLDTALSWPVAPMCSTDF